MDAPDLASKADPRAQRISPAFTLLEVLIALTILSLAAVGAGLAAPAWLGRAELERTAAAFDRLALSARTAALATGRPTILAFDAAVRTLAVRTRPAEDVGDVLGHTAPGAVLASGAAPRADVFTVSASVGLTLTGVAGAPSGSHGTFGSSASGGGVAIVFLPDGTSTGGLVALTQGDRRLTRRVAWLTGKVGPGE